MSCWHGHDCGPWHGGPCGPGWWGPRDWYEDVDRPLPRRYRRSAGSAGGTSADELEVRLEAVLEEVRRLETELAGLRGGGGESMEGG
jgi:hypothetical protein